MKKVEIKKIVNNRIETFYPKTSADIVQYDANRTVYAILTDLLTRVENIEDTMSTYTQVYATDAISGDTITDESGNGVILMGASDRIIATDSDGIAIDDGSGDNVILMHDE